jgi:hypothetical protein
MQSRTRDMNRAVLTTFLTAGMLANGTLLPGRANSYDSLKWGFINKSGLVAAAPRWDSAHNFSDGLAVVELADRSYVIEKNGAVAFELPRPVRTAFDWKYGGGRFAVQLGERWGFFDTSGKEVVPARFSHIYGFADGFWDVTGDVKNPTKTGMLQVDGNGLLKNCSYVASGSLHEGLARVWVGNKAGFVDAKGKLVIPAKFVWADDFHDGVSLVVINGKRVPGSISRWDGEKGAIDTSGNLLFEHQFYYVDSFHCGLARVWQQSTPDESRKSLTEQVQAGRSLFPTIARSRPLGFINKTGQLIIRFDREGNTGPVCANSFSEGLAVAWLGGKYGYIDATGRFAVVPQFDYARDFADGLAAVKKEGKWGFIDKNGNFVIQPRFSEIFNPAVFSLGAPARFCDGLIPAKENEKWGFIDKTGAFVIEPIYPEVREFSEGLAAVAVGVDRSDLYRASGMLIGHPPRHGPRSWKDLSDTFLADGIKAASEAANMEKSLTSQAQAQTTEFYVNYISKLTWATGNLLDAAIFSPEPRPELCSEVKDICDYELKLVDSANGLTQRDAWNILTALAYRYDWLHERSVAAQLYERATKINKGSLAEWTEKKPDLAVKPGLIAQRIDKITRFALPAQQNPSTNWGSYTNYLRDSYSFYSDGFAHTHKFLIERGEIDQKAQHQL